jgi:hypothetical protein
LIDRRVLVALAAHDVSLGHPSSGQVISIAFEDIRRVEYFPTISPAFRLKSARSTMIWGRQVYEGDTMSTRHLYLDSTPLSLRFFDLLVESLRGPEKPTLIVP